MRRVSAALHDVLHELRRRRVGRVAAAYVVGAWLLVEVADTVLPRLGLPDSAVTLVIIAVVAGFPVALALAWWFDVVPDTAGTAGPRTRAGGLMLIVVVSVLAVGAGARAWSLVTGGDRIRSLVVLPLADRTGDPERQYFVAGMHDALLGELARLPGLRTISRTSALRYADSRKSVPEIARELDVDAVVEGSVEWVDPDVRIEVRLVRAGEREESLWSQTFSRRLTEVRLLHADVARAIAARIDGRSPPQPSLGASAADSVDPLTYEAYLRGLYHLNRSTPEEIEEGLGFLHAAVDRDPGDARAYAGLAFGYAQLGHGFSPGPDAWSRARAAALRAVALDPDLAEAHAVLADIKLYYERDWEGAEEAFMRANELNPNLAMNHYHYAWYLALFDRLEEAIEEHRMAQRLDPLDPLHTAWLGTLLNMAGRHEEALVEARAALEIVPDNPHGLWNLGDAHYHLGNAEEAIAAHRKLGEVVPPARWALGVTYARLGRTAEARRVADAIEAGTPTSFEALGLGAIYGHLGEMDAAFRWLDHEPDHGWLAWVRNLDWFEPVRADPRYEVLMERLGLPPLPGR